MEENINPKVGRPTKFEDWMYADIIARAKNGQCMQFIAMEWDVDFSTMRAWTKTNEKFSKAYTRARDNFIAGILQETRRSLGDRNFNDRAARLLLGFFTKYSDTRNVETKDLKEALAQKDYAQACGIVAQLADDGKVSADELNKMMGTVTQAANAHKIGDMDARMDVLEKVLAEHP